MEPKWKFSVDLAKDLVGFVKVDNQGRIVIPKDVREEMGFEPRAGLFIFRSGNDFLIFKKKREK